MEQYILPHNFLSPLLPSESFPPFTLSPSPFPFFYPSSPVPLDPHLKCCVHLDHEQTGLSVLEVDIPQLTGRHLCKELMPVQFVLYSEGVSSTLLRAQLQARQEQ